MPTSATEQDRILAKKVAGILHDNFDELIGTFRLITSGAKTYFEQRRFTELFAEAQKRYRLYKGFVTRTLVLLDTLMGDRITDTELWKLCKEEYAALISSRNDMYVAESFFNSITRKIFHHTGLNKEIEFFDFGEYHNIEYAEPKVYDTIPGKFLNVEMIKALLSSFGFNVPYIDIDRDSQLILDEIAPAIVLQKGTLEIDGIDYLKVAFYRNKGAFIIARMRHQSWVMPLLIPILNKEEGLFADAAIYNYGEISIVFSFTRASFFAHTEKPLELIAFLKSLMPHKSIGELYDSIGYYRHGKTMLYRDLYRYITHHDDKFIIAPGIKGMVMCVFTLKNYNFVFKIIRDKFENPKNITRAQVIKKYEEVEINDRVGRMAYAHLFEHLEFDRHMFSNELVEELQTVAKDTVTFTEDKVHIKHVYLERKMTPLNLFLETASEADAIGAILDYGYCIKELAAANIFPGDLLMKNFGVTRHGRVIFYDYDEIARVTDCNFRRLPEPTDDYHGAEPSFSVNTNDIFPEEFKNFMVPGGNLGDVFQAEHADLFQAKWWRSIQRHINNGELLEFFAYNKTHRFNQYPEVTAALEN
jgi:isocitrate dehydrogenase kinase/phosphatase